MQLFTIRQCFLGGFLLTCLLLAFAGYLQFSKGLLPCPLCQLQRIALGFIGITFLFAAIHHAGRRGTIIYSLIILSFSLLGTALAARHIWIQNAPSDQLTRCGVGIDYLLNHFPFWQSLKIILYGTDNCTTVHWHLLGLSIPEWTLIAFIAIGFLALIQIIRASMHNKKQ